MQLIKIISYIKILELVVHFCIKVEPIYSPFYHKVHQLIQIYFRKFHFNNELNLIHFPLIKILTTHPIYSKFDSLNTIFCLNFDFDLNYAHP